MTNNAIAIFMAPRRLRDDFVGAQSREEVGEHVFCIDAVVKPSLTRLDRACDIIKFHQTQDSIRERPRSHLLVGFG